MARINYAKFMRSVGSSDVTAVASNPTTNETPPRWNSEPMYQLPPWGEPLVRSVEHCTHYQAIAKAGRLS